MFGEIFFGNKKINNYLLHFLDYMIKYMYKVKWLYTYPFRKKIRRYLLWLTKFPTLASAAALAQQNVPFQQSLRVTVSTLSTLIPALTAVPAQTYVPFQLLLLNNQHT